MPKNFSAPVWGTVAESSLQFEVNKEQELEDRKIVEIRSRARAGEKFSQAEMEEYGSEIEDARLSAAIAQSQSQTFTAARTRELGQAMMNCKGPGTTGP
jgi:hypothetical protein